MTNVFLLIYQLGSCCVYVVFISTNLQSVSHDCKISSQFYRYSSCLAHVNKINYFKYTSSYKQNRKFFLITNICSLLPRFISVILIDLKVVHFQGDRMRFYIYIYLICKKYHSNFDTTIIAV